MTGNPSFTPPSEVTDADMPEILSHVRKIMCEPTDAELGDAVGRPVSEQTTVTASAPEDECDRQKVMGMLKEVRPLIAGRSPAISISLLQVELEEARRRQRAVESVLLTLISQEFDGDARRMAREILDLRMRLGEAECLR